MSSSTSQHPLRRALLCVHNALLWGFSSMVPALTLYALQYRQCERTLCFLGLLQSLWIYKGAMTFVSSRNKVSGSSASGPCSSRTRFFKASSKELYCSRRTQYRGTPPQTLYSLITCFAVRLSDLNYLIFLKDCTYIFLYHSFCNYLIIKKYFIFTWNK